MPESLIVKIAYILAPLPKGEWFSYQFSSLRKMTYKLKKNQTTIVLPKKQIKKCLGQNVDEI